MAVSSGSIARGPVLFFLFATRKQSRILGVSPNHLETPTHFLLSALVLASGFGMPSVGRADPDPPTIVYAAWEFSESDASKSTINNYYCKQETNCPIYTQVVTRSGDWLGCKVSLGACSGECYMCSGSSLPISICRKRTGESCAPLVGAAAGVSCGTKIKGQCSSTGLNIGSNTCGCAFASLLPSPPIPANACVINGCI